MKKNELRKESGKLLWGSKLSYKAREAKDKKIAEAIESFESRISGKKGAEEARDRFFASLESLYRKKTIAYLTQAQRKARFIRQSAENLAALANLRNDEHGSYDRGDHLFVKGLDFIGPWESSGAPYWDMGGEGLGIVEVTRTRVYAARSHWKPSCVTTKFLVGKNEVGTYFSHPVSPNCSMVEEAVQWIWSGKAYNIIQRQGDIALIGGNGGPKMPQYLPTGHKVKENIIVHATHPDIPMPSRPGERIIVGRRAAERASEATRD